MELELKLDVAVHGVDFLNSDLRAELYALAVNRGAAGERADAADFNGSAGIGLDVIVVHVAIVHVAIVFAAAAARKAEHDKRNAQNEARGPCEFSHFAVLLSIK